jgi:hypothetical protein
MSYVFIRNKKKTFLVGFLGGFLRLLGGFLGFFLGGFFIANPGLK